MFLRARPAHSVLLASLVTLGLLVTAAPAAATSGFVEANGTSFVLNGAPWRPIGFNQYRLTSMPGGYVCDGGYGPISDASLGQRLDDMKAAGANVVRTWFFQSYFDGGGWAAFDRLLTAAASRGMTVIPVLVNQFVDCEAPTIEKNVGFFDYAFRSPGFGYGRSFKDYAQMVAAHYAENRTIAFWQLVNEAEAQYQGCPAGAATVLRSFAGEMRTALRSVDPNHLVSLGTIGSGQCGASFLEYKYVHEAVDICEVHDYGSPQSAMPGDAFNGIALRIQQCNELGKPIFVGEAGIRADVGPDGSATGAVTQATLDTRARFFKAKITRQLAAGMNGYLIWEKLLENSDSKFNLAGERFGVGRLGVGTTEDPLAQVMRDAGPRPSPAISSGPSGQTSSPAPTFTFASRDPTATFECRVDAAPFAACVSPYTTPPLEPGTHTFEVRAVNPAAATDPTFARRTFTIDEPPTAAYAPSSSAPAVGQTVSFDGRASSDPDGSIVSYRWVWGDGTPDGSGATPAHVFTAAGARSVGVYVTDSDGRTATVAQGITVGSGDESPTAAYTPSTYAPTVGHTVSLNGTASIDPDGSIITYRWVWNDGTADSSGPTPTHVFTTPGTRSVGLYVTDSDGRTAVVGHGITVGSGDESPAAAYTPSTYAPTIGQTVSFNGSASTDPDGTIVTYRWVWGDNTPDGSGPTPTHVFSTTGLRSVSLYVTDSDGQTAAVGHGITAGSGDESPTAGYTPSTYTLALGQTVSLNGSASRDPDGSIVSYRWVWGDGTPDGSGATASHVFATVGLRSVTLYVTDSDGQTAAVGHGITIG